MTASGVWLQKTNHGGGAPIVRGLMGNQVLMLIDGIRLNNFTYRYGPNQYLNTIDPGIVEQIEITRGSGAVLYGSDAMGGVVQVVTKTPTFSSARKINATLAGRWMSQRMENSGRAGVSASSKSMAIIGGYSQRNFGDLVAGGALGTLSPTGYSENSGDIKVLVRTGNQSVITGAFQRTSQQSVSRFDQVTLGGYRQYQFNPQVRQLGYIRWEVFSTKWWREVIKVTYANGYTSERLQTQRENAVVSRTFHDRVKTNAIILEVLAAPRPGWNVISGAEIYGERIGSEAVEINPLSNTRVAIRGTLANGSSGRSMSLFNHHRLSLRKLEVSSGFRLNGILVQVNDATFGDQRLSANAVVGDLGVRYNAGKIVRPFASIQSAFRAPNVDDMSKFGAVEANVFEIPSSTLASERSLQTEVGLRLNHRLVNASLAWYHTQLTNLIDRTAVNYLGSSTFEGRTVYQKQNVGLAVLKGIESEFELAVSPKVRVTGNLTYTHGTNTTTDNPMRRVPPLFGRARASFNHKKWWMSGEIALAHDQKRLAPADRSDVRISSRLKDGVMPGWTSVNVSGGADFRSWSMVLNVLNVFDKAYRFYGSGVDEYGQTLSLSFNVRF